MDGIIWVPPQMEPIEPIASMALNSVIQFLHQMGSHFYAGDASKTHSNGPYSITLIQ